MARPSKLNPELTERIVELIIAGNRPQLAANLAGVSSSTFFDWMSRGKHSEPGFQEFSESVERGFAQAVVQKIGIIHRAATKGEWRASAWWLEKNAPEEFGRKKCKFCPPERTRNAKTNQVTIEELELKIAQINADRVSNSASNSTLQERSLRNQGEVIP